MGNLQSRQFNGRNVGNRRSSIMCNLRYPGVVRRREQATIMAHNPMLTIAEWLDLLGLQQYEANLQMYNSLEEMFDFSNKDLKRHGIRSSAHRTRMLNSLLGVQSKRRQSIDLDVRSTSLASMQIRKNSCPPVYLAPTDDICEEDDYDEIITTKSGKVLKILSFDETTVIRFSPCPTFECFKRACITRIMSNLSNYLWLFVSILALLSFQLLSSVRADSDSDSDSDSGSNSGEQKSWYDKKPKHKGQHNNLPAYAYPYPGNGYAMPYYYSGYPFAPPQAPQQPAAYPYPYAPQPYPPYGEMAYPNPYQGAVPYAPPAAAQPAVNTQGPPTAASSVINHTLKVNKEYNENGQQTI